AISLLDDRNLAIVHDGVMIGRYHRGESGQESMVLAEVDGQTTWRTMHRDPLGRLVAIDEPHGRITVRRGADGTVQGWEGFGEAVELERDAAGRVQHVRASNGEETAF